MKIAKKLKTIVHGNPTRSPLSFYINLCNPGECRKMHSIKNTSEWSIIASEDDIPVLFFHVVLSTAPLFSPSIPRQLFLHYLLSAGLLFATCFLKPTAISVSWLSACFQDSLSSHSCSFNLCELNNNCNNVSFLRFLISFIRLKHFNLTFLKFLIAFQVRLKGTISWDFHKTFKS